MDIAQAELQTPRLVLGPWRPDDAEAGLRIFGDEDVSRWLAPAMDRVSDIEAMRGLIDGWAANDQVDMPPVGHWTVTRRDDGELIGSVTVRHMPPYNDDLELAWQFVPAQWGQGYASESAFAVARWAFERSAHELFAVLRPGNERAVKLAARLGMQWVGETDKYYDLRLQVYRVRPPELREPTAPVAG